MPEPSLDMLTAQCLTPDARLEAILAEMAQEIPGTKALVIGDASGLPVATVVRGRKTLATTAMATLALSAATKVTASLGLDAPDDILIEAGRWLIIVKPLGHGFTLCGVFPGGGNLRTVRVSMLEHAVEICELLEILR